MRSLIKIGLGLLLALPASAQWTSLSGQLITVKVEAPANAASAKVDLEEGLRGLELEPDGKGGWSGSFAALPEMTGEQFKPRVTVYDANGKEMLVTPHRGVVVQLASSEFDSSSLSAENLGRETRFVFNDSIAPNSIAIRTSPSGPAYRPRLGHNSFTLPDGVTPGDITTIAARSREGRAIVLSTEQDVDVANDEEDLEDLGL